MALDPLLLGPRVESYWVEVLDEDENRIDTLDGIGGQLADSAHPATPSGPMGVTDGSLSYNVDSEIMGGGSLTILNADLDWMSIRLRPWVLVNNQKWPLGVYLPAAPETAHSAAGRSTAVSMLDKTSMLSATQLTKTYSVGQSTSVVAAVQGILSTFFGVEPEQVALTPSAKTPSATMTWTPGTTYLKVINELLGAIAYNNIWCDRFGRFRAEPWVDPATTIPTMVFAEGDQAIHSQDFTVSQDVSSVPNRVICQTSGDDTKAAMVSVATNTDPASPYCYDNRGRWVDMFFDSVEAADQATLDKIAHKNLADNSTPPWYVSVSHAVVPIQGRDVVRLTSDGVDRVAWVNEWGITLRAGALMTGKWKGVTS